MSRLSRVRTRGRYSQPDFRSGIQLGTRTQSGIVEDCPPPGGNGELGSAPSPHCGYYDPLFLSHHYDQKKTLSYIVFTSQQFSDIIHQPNHIQFSFCPTLLLTPRLKLKFHYVSFCVNNDNLTVCCSHSL